MAPFICLALIALGLARPLPTFPPPLHGRTVVDADGERVVIPWPMRGVVDFGATDFLEMTHEPRLLLQGGGQRQRVLFADSSLESWLYPQVLHDDRVWREPADIESIVAQDDGAVYLGRSKALRRLGVVVFSAWPSHRTSIDDTVFRLDRTMNALVGRTDRSRLMIARYQRAYAALRRALRPATIRRRPRALELINSAKDWTRLDAFDIDDDEATGLAPATTGYRNLGRYGDAERILAMNPDIVIVRVGNAEDVLHDPRWQGLTAVRTRRVYANPFPLRGWTYSIDGRPLGARWLAEIAHPDRLQARLRGLIRRYYQEAYRHRFSDADIDRLLHVTENRDSLGYARFSREAARP